MVWMVGMVLLLVFAFAGFASYCTFKVLHSINNTITLAMLLWALARDTNALISNIFSSCRCGKWNSQFQKNDSGPCVSNERTCNIVAGIVLLKVT